MSIVRREPRGGIAGKSSYPGDSDELWLSSDSDSSGPGGPSAPPGSAQQDASELAGNAPTMVDDKLLQIIHDQGALSLAV